MSEAVSLIQEHAPNAFDINKHIKNMREGLMTRNGVEEDVYGILAEITGQPLGRRFDMIWENGKLVSPDFKKPLTELYSQPIGNTIFDNRSWADVAAIEKLEEYMKQEGDFSYAIVSPTSEGMSKISMVEIGQRRGGRIKSVRLAIPHRVGQSVQDANSEMFELAKYISQGDEQYWQNVASVLPPDGMDELRLVANPIKFDGWYLMDHLDDFVQQIDGYMEEITGIKHHTGKTTLEATREQYAYTNALDQIKQIRDSNGFNSIERYVSGLEKGYDLNTLQKEFNNLVNLFMKSYRNFLNIGSASALNNVVRLENSKLESLWSPVLLEQFDAYCGKISQVSGGIAYLGGGGDRYLSDLSRSLPDNFGEPKFGECKWCVEREGDHTHKTVGGCDLCIKHHYVAEKEGSTILSSQYK